MKRILTLALSFIALQGFGGTNKYGALVEAQKEAAAAASPLKPAKVSEISANLFSTIYDFLKDAAEHVFEGFISLKDFVETGEWLVQSLHTPESREILESFSFRLLMAFLVAFGISRLLSLWVRPRINRLLHWKKGTSEHTRLKLVGAVLLSMLSPLVFGFILYAFFRSIAPQKGAYLEVVRIISSGWVTIWILLNVAHLFLKPISPRHQHIPLKEEVLSTIYRWIRRIGIVALFGYFALETGSLIDLPRAGERLLLQGSGFIIMSLAILMMLSLHEELKAWIKKEAKNSKISPTKRAMLPYISYGYLPLIAFIVVSYVSWVTREYDEFQIIIWKALLTLAVFPALRLMGFCLRKMRIVYFELRLKHYFRPLAERICYYGNQLDFALLFLFHGAAILFVLYLWGWDPATFIFSPLSRLIVQKSFSIFMIIFVALLITRFGNDLLKRYLNRERKALTEAEIQRTARFRTISSVSRNVWRIAVWTPAILLIVIELDVDVVPILATVGILSIGLSFGIQFLVKDLVSGFFMLLEDAFAVGDLVVINGQMGRIESLTVRVVRVRATDGSLFTYPYGSITSLCNQNRDYSAAVVLFKVGLEANIDDIFEIVEKVSADLRKDKKIKPFLLEPVEISGVNEISDYGFEIRAILKTKPSQQYKVRWAFNRLLKQYLESYKIPPAVPRQVSLNYALEK
jgi:small-conductance mechanosensitive channel